MSLNFDLYKSSGKVPCPPGAMRVKTCRMIMNAGSEDLLSDNIFGRIRLLHPRLWLPALFTAAYPHKDLPAFDYDKFDLAFWPKVPPMLFKTGVSEFDIFITVSPVKIVIECKYGAPVDEDQIRRYLNLLAYRYYRSCCQDVHFILVTNTDHEPEELSKYKNIDTLAGTIEIRRLHVNYKKLYLNLASNIGWLSWGKILSIIEAIPTATLHYSEQQIINVLIEYLRFKIRGEKPKE